MMLIEGRRDVGIILLLVDPKTHQIVYSSYVAQHLIERTQRFIKTFKRRSIISVIPTIRR